MSGCCVACRDAALCIFFETDSYRGRFWLCLVEMAFEKEVEVNENYQVECPAI